MSKNNHPDFYCDRWTGGLDRNKGCDKQCHSCNMTVKYRQLETQRIIKEIVLTNKEDDSRRKESDSA